MNVDALTAMTFNSKTDSIFEDTEIPPTETFAFTKSFDEWKESFLNNPGLSGSNPRQFDQQDILNLFPTLSKFNYFMTAPTALFVGIQIEAKARACKSLKIKEVNEEIEEIISANPNAVLYSLNRIDSFDAQTQARKITFKIRFGTIE